MSICSSIRLIGSPLEDYMNIYIGDLMGPYQVYGITLMFFSVTMSRILLLEAHITATFLDIKGITSSRSVRIANEISHQAESEIPSAAVPAPSSRIFAPSKIWASL
jgi:hypothetical protein